MSRAIPAVKTWSVKFYRKGELRPYDEIQVNAPTKFLAKLNARHCFGKKFYLALAALGYDHYTIGMLRSKLPSAAAKSSFANSVNDSDAIDTDLEDQRAEMLQEMAEEEHHCLEADEALSGMKDA